MAAVGVASFPCPAFDQSDASLKEYLKSHESLLMDLLDGSLVGVCGEEYVTYTLDVMQLVMRGGGVSVQPPAGCDSQSPLALLSCHCPLGGCHAYSGEGQAGCVGDWAV